MTDARPTTEALGQSGASVRVFPHMQKAVKTGDQRVHEQGLWLQIHEAPGLVRVETTGLMNLQGVKQKFPTATRYSYDMEILNPIPFRSTHPRGLADEIAQVLARDVWAHDPDPAPVFNWEVHHEYVGDRIGAYAPELREPMLDALVRLMDATSAGKIPSCLTHGDPTFANTMLRGQQHVLIDPLPQTEYMPPFRAVDLGKIVQSLLGYEERRFGWYMPVRITPFEITNWLTDTFDLDDEEVFATWYFATLHFLRLMPYTPPEHYDAMTELLEHAATHLA